MNHREMAKKLLKMTVDRGCSPREAVLAAKALAELTEKYNLDLVSIKNEKNVEESPRRDWRQDVDSGGDPLSRNREAQHILFKLGLSECSFEREKEEDFISSLLDRFSKFGDKTVISSKQLFWLRDLKEKYL